MKTVEFGDLKVGQKFADCGNEYIKIEYTFVSGRRDPRIGIDEPSYHYNAINLKTGCQEYFEDDQDVRV